MARILCSTSIPDWRLHASGWQRDSYTFFTWPQSPLKRTTAVGGDLEFSILPRTCECACASIGQLPVPPGQSKVVRMTMPRRLSVQSGLLRFALTLLCCAPLWAAQPGPPDAYSARGGNAVADLALTAFARAQAAKRDQRLAVLNACQKDLAKARAKGLAELEKLLRWAAENGMVGNAFDLYVTLRRAYPDHAWPVEIKRAFNAAPDPNVDPKRVADYQRRCDSALQAFGSYLMGPAKACFSVRIFDRTYDILLEILHVAPDDRNARNYLGYALVTHPVTRRREWLLRSDAEHLNRREQWLEGLGWIPQAQVERHQKGEYFENGRWTTLEAANRRHADPADPWAIASPHFTLRTTLDRAAAVHLSVALEAYYRLVYKDFLGFFAPDGGALDLLFDTRAATRPLVVNFFATEAQYAEFVRGKYPDAKRAALLLASQGFYSSQLGESVFYKTTTSEQDLRIAFHETTHQILGEYIRGHSGCAWLAEMPAVYMERVQWRGGQIDVPAWSVGSRTRAARLDGQPMRIDQFTALTDLQFHDETGDNRSRHYAVAGGLTDFLMNAEGGIYRQAFMEYLRAGYQQEKLAPLHEYLGLTAEAAEARWLAYQQATFAGLGKNRMAEPHRRAAPAAEAPYYLVSEPDEQPNSVRKGPGKPAAVASDPTRPRRSSD